MSTKTEEMIRLQPDWLARVPNDRRFPPGQLLFTVDLAAARGARPDLIRRDDERWARAAAAHE